METTYNFFVYVQALGGKFLGPNAWNPKDIKVILKTASKEYDLSYYDGTQNDGNLPSSAYLYDKTSFLPIITYNPLKATVPPQVNYLTPNDQTVVARGEVALPERMVEMANLYVDVPLPQGNLLLNQTVLLNSHQDNYKLTVVVPGLLFKQVTVSGSTLRATVTMMCGCEIKDAFFWIPSDFEVFAHVSYKGGVERRFQLQFDSVTNASVFVCDIQNHGDPTSIVFTARQLSTGNCGFYKFDFKELL